METLKALPPGDLKGLKFYTADVCALFTNVNVRKSIEYVLDLANEHWDSITTFGLELTDLHRILEVVLINSFFTFNNRLYQQTYGAFIGCSVSPPCAMITVYRMEKESIHVDSYYLSSPVRYLYVRYVDDSGSLAYSKEEAIRNCKVISDMDTDGRILWEVEYPDNEDEYVAFLDTEIRINSNGTLSTRYYRKPQNKGISLNYSSHHQLSTKLAVANNYYKTASEVSSGADELKHSESIVDKVLEQNGYPKPRKFITSRRKCGESAGKKKKVKPITNVCIPYTSERDSNRIRNYVKSKNIPVRPVFTPGTTLKQIFCNSRPLDTTSCVLSNPDRCQYALLSATETVIVEVPCTRSFANYVQQQ